MFSVKVTRPSATTLVAATATSALAMSVFLPSLPQMAAAFGVSYADIQLTLSVYLAATTVVNLVAGPLSDRVGRRPVMLFCFIVFLIGSMVSVLAPNLEILLLSRVLQAFSAAGLILSRAIARDISDTADAAVLISHITMGMALVPMVGPVLGATLQEWFGWRSSFVFNFVFGAIALVLLVFRLPETSRGATTREPVRLADYGELLATRSFWGYTGATLFVTSAYMAFLGGGPYIADTHFGLRPLEYAGYFAANAAGYLLGNFASGRLSRKIGIDRLIVVGGVLCILPLLVALVLFQAGVSHPLAFFAPISLMGIGNGMVQPNAATGVVSVQPCLSGAASGLCGSLQIGAGAVAAYVAGVVVLPDGNPVPLLVLMLTCMVLGLLSALMVKRSPAGDGRNRSGSR